jgi:hypothetical protein
MKLGTHLISAPDIHHSQGHSPAAFAAFIISDGVEMKHRHEIAACDLSLIKWDQVQIIFTHASVLSSLGQLKQLITNRLISGSIMAIHLPLTLLQTRRSPRK